MSTRTSAQKSTPISTQPQPASAPALFPVSTTVAKRLAGRLRTTPGRLQAAIVVLVVGAALFWAVVASVFSDLHAAVRTVGRDTVPSIVAAEKMNVALADINTNFVNAILAKADDGGPAWRTIKEDSDAVSHALITAGENVTYGAEEEAPIYTIQSNLPVYFGLLGQARSKLQSDPLPDTRAASDLMQKTIMSAGFALDEANFRHLTASYDQHLADSGVAWITLLLAIGTLGGLLIAVQVDLIRRTRRLINAPLFAATAAVAIFAVYLIIVFAGAGEQLRAAKQDSFDSIHALWKARAIAYDANAEESLYLLERGPLQTRHEQAFVDLSAQLLSGLPPAGALAEATAGRVKDIKGFIGVELNNITYPGEREAALELLRTFVEYVGIDRRIRDLERAGRHAEALALCVGTAPGQSDWAFQQFDEALVKVLNINERFFAAQIETAFSYLAWIPWASPLVAIAIAALSWLGLQPRIREYWV
jgi:hypothetical protein